MASTATMALQRSIRSALQASTSAAASTTSTSITGTTTAGRASTSLHSRRRSSTATTSRHNAVHPRLLHSSIPSRAHFSFDTSSLVARLEKEGLTRNQALGVMEALEEVVEESIRTMTANLVTRAEQEKHQYTQKVDFAKLKSEITLLEKQDFSLLKSENERLLSG